MFPSLKILSPGALLLASLCAAIVPISLPAQPAPAPAPENRVESLFSQLTPDEKLTLLQGTGFTTAPIPRLHIPAMGMVDAGQGVRGGSQGTQGPATLFPSGVAMAATWDPALVGKIGEAIGTEALNKGTGAQILLGPAVNIDRSPLGGRNGEYFSEDPYLASRLAVGYIEGLQSSGASACIKHFACNNEESDRGDVNVHVSERALREIYLPAFEAGVQEAHVWSLMSSYNQINGFHATANHYLLTDVLKKGWGFDGLVMSDWGAVHAAAPVLMAGNDLEMPGPGGFMKPETLKAALADGTLTQAAVDDSVRRILRTLVRTGLMDHPAPPDPQKVNTPEHQKLTFEAASQAIVLLKNDGNLLPLDPATIHSIAVIGAAASGMQLGAEGSPHVTPFYSIQPLDGITQRAGPGIAVRYASGPSSVAAAPIPASALKPPDGGNNESGLRAEYFTNSDLQGQPVLVRTETRIGFDLKPDASAGPAPGIGLTHFSVRWTGTLTAPVTGTYQLNFTSDDGCRLFFDGKPVIDDWEPEGRTPHPVTLDLTAGHTYPLRIEYFQAGGDAIAKLEWKLPEKFDVAEAAAVAAARQSDLAIVCVTTRPTEGEGRDRPSMDLPDRQGELIRAVAAANPKTIVVVNSGTPVTIQPWLDGVPALLQAWFPGQEGGKALAAILFGDVNPSGKLPVTFGLRREDYPDHGHFPGVQGQVDYAEGIYVGYRHFDKEGIAPLFPFGYGLSYTTFAYSNPRLSRPTVAPGGTVTVSVDVTNTGKRAGDEIAELYLHDPAPRIDRPLRELKGFARLTLQPGETQTATFPLTPRALAYCDVPGQQWKADPGPYQIEIGASSRDIRQTLPLTLTAPFTEAIPFMATDGAAK